MKIDYIVPETKEIIVAPAAMLAISDFDGAQSEGFSEFGSYGDGDWGIL